MFSSDSFMFRKFAFVASDCNLSALISVWKSISVCHTYVVGNDFVCLLFMCTYVIIGKCLCTSCYIMYAMSIPVLYICNICVRHVYNSFVYLQLNYKKTGPLRFYIMLEKYLCVSCLYTL